MTTVNIQTGNLPGMVISADGKSLTYNGLGGAGNAQLGLRGTSSNGLQTADSNLFNCSIIEEVPPVIEDTWERLDIVAGFNDPPAQTGLQGPSFGGAGATPAGDIYYRNHASTPHWNCIFRWATKTLEGFTLSTDASFGTSHNTQWCTDPDRNVLWGVGTSPATPGWLGMIKFDLVANTWVNTFPENRNPPVPGDAGPPYYEGIASQSGACQYVGNRVYAFGSWGGSTNQQVMGLPIRSRDITQFGVLPTTVHYPGDGFGFPQPTIYSGDPGRGEYPYLTAGVDSRTLQCWYIDPAFDLWVNNSITDGVARPWIKVPTYGTRPINVSPAAPEWRRQACLHEARNCIVVLATQGPSSRSSFTGVLDLSTLMWRVGPSGNDSPLVNTYGITPDGPGDEWYFSGQTLYDRVNERVITIQPYSGGTAFYQLHVAGPSL